LLLHGTHERVVPVEHLRELYRAYSQAGVPVVYTELRGVAHVFDLALLRTSPSAQTALNDVKRFLALMSCIGA
jgi:acetyl esterase/lipase